MLCCTLLYVHSSFVLILMGERKLVSSLSLSSRCFLMVVWLFLAVPCSPVENKNDLELDFKVFFFTDSCCSDLVRVPTNYRK